MPRGMWDLSSPTRDRTCAPPAVEVWSPNHWTTREVPQMEILELKNTITKLKAWWISSTAEWGWKRKESVNSKIAQ